MSVHASLGVGRRKEWGKIIEFVRRSASFVQAEVDDALATSAAMQEAVADFAALSGADAGVVLHLKSRAAPSELEMARLVGDTSREKRILGLPVDVCGQELNLGSGTCVYQTSGGGFSSGNSPGATSTVPTGYMPSTGPTGTAMGGGAGSTVLNANNPGGNSMYGGYDSPTSLMAGSGSLSCGWILYLIWMIAFAFVKENCSVAPLLAVTIQVVY